jgi:predicted ATPase
MLKRVSIQNFKSLKDVTLDLQPVNLLIGPNNSGKTNFLKAFEYFQDRLDYRSYTFDDFDRVEYKHEKNYKIVITLTRYSKDQNREQITLTTTPSMDEAEVIHTKFIDSSSSDSILGESSHSEVYELSDDSLRKGSDGKITDRIFSFTLIRGFIGKVRIYKLDSSAIINPNNLNPDEYVHEDASNTTSFILNIGQNHKAIFDEIQNKLAECVGDVVRLASPTVRVADGYKLRLKLFDKADNDYWADEVSEGVLYFLALLCIINQPKPPKLLLLEEPEKGIHPRRIKEVIEFIRRLVAEKDVQVIMTTHSPLVLNEFNDSPECVFIFDKDEEGATHVKNLQRDVIEPDLELSRQNGVEPPNYTDSLGDSWTIGFLGGVPK